MLRKVWQYSKSYNILRYYVDFTTKHLFSSLEISGLENIPKDGMIMYAPNHCAALLDPLMILLLKKEPVAFGARFDIFRNPKAVAILRYLRILPIARERDGLDAVASNFNTFDEIIECLDNGVPFTLYSEGTHRAARGMLPVKKGIFRIAKMAAEKTGKTMWIVPVGIDYEYFFRESGRAAVRVGEPLNLMKYFEEHQDLTEFQIYRNLCNWLQESDLSLIGRIPQRRHDRLAGRMILGALSLPVFAAFAIPAAPIWLSAIFILRKFEDKAWTHTVYFGLRLALPIFAPFHMVFEYLRKFYTNIIEDLRMSGK